MSDVGRPRTSNRILVEDTNVLEIGQVVTHHEGEILESITMSFKWTDGTEGVQTFRLGKTRPYFGGERPWFLCPGCGRKCGKLHAVEGIQHFACRVCLRLAYDRQYRKSRAAVFRRSLVKLQAQRVRVPPLLGGTVSSRARY